jgi:hypothetical protein
MKTDYKIGDYVKVLPGAMTRGGHKVGETGKIVRLFKNRNGAFIEVKGKDEGDYYWEELEPAESPEKLPEPGSPVIHKIQRVKGE